MNKQTQEALKMAIEALDESMPLVFGNGVALEMMKTPLIEVEKKVNFHKKAINACKEALEQPTPPEKTTSLEDVIKEFEKDPEMKALLDLARKQVRGMELKQPAQEPVAWMNDIAYSDEIDNLPANRGEIIPLYSHPHQDGTSPSGTRDKEFVTLTDDEIAKLIDIEIYGEASDELLDNEAYTNFARAIEQALKEKNYAL